VELRYSKRAQRDILERSMNWRAHYPERPDFFDDELERILGLLRDNPRMGHVTTRYKGARVFVLVDVEHLLFYRLGKRHVAVLALLPARTQRTPSTR
jgi:plasmid stabilization system protein ParE